MQQAPEPQPDADPLLPLLLASQGGDQDAFHKLYDAARRRLFGLALTIVNSAADAEDVVAETFVQAWRSAQNYDPSRGSVMTWLLVICRSRALDLRRRHRVPMEDIDEAILPMLEQEDWPDAPGSRRIARGMARLSDIQRQLIALAFYRGMTHQEISATTTLPLGTIKSHIRRALQSLRAELERV